MVVKMSRNNGGWIRILEATIAIMIVAGVLLVVASRSPVNKEDLSDEVYQLQREVLNDILLKPELRNYAFNNDTGGLDEFAKTKIPDSFNFSIKICELINGNGDVAGCKMDSYIPGDVYAEEIVLGTDVTSSQVTPKKVKLFIWENR